MSNFDKVKEFQNKTKFKVGSLDANDTTRIEQRVRLIAEEVQELISALGYDSILTIFYPQSPDQIYCTSAGAEGTFDPENVLKEACDVGVVVEGTIAEFGWDYDAARALVDENNLTKVQDGAKYVNGKLQKPKGYKKVDLSHLVK